MRSLLRLPLGLTLCSGSALGFTRTPCIRTHLQLRGFAHLLAFRFRNFLHAQAGGFSNLSPRGQKSRYFAPCKLAHE